ncbi:helix-turn-helix protein [Streptomyces sp. Amel2xB2]|uniref:XRE family transcriptional regulator n=1 Tax=Streptomyces nanshensis TaxID=518642 RepID=A0A1E7KM17_9ACTN|nr:MULTISPECIES: helix-turn-helix transcriptional regulator [Streptomyces]OEV05022.1 XRE family transcriptional regulator [Streptomyces nanshensis]RAJ68951.1 helix-turn-helix protein [Streptomyces sp. Amel2xB2]
MRISEISGNLPDRRVPDRPPGPAVPRLVLGERLRRLREAQYISREEAGEAIKVSDVTIAQLERGRSAVRERDVTDLLSIYGLSDADEQATLRALAVQSNAPGWWHAYHDIVPDWFHTYLGLEQAADVIRSYEVQFVPGLLQTPEYARAVIELGHAGAPAAQLRRRTELRMLRQRILHGRRPPHLWAVIDEAALRRGVGGPETMRGQLEHLIAACELPHVTVHVMPFSAGGHAAAGGPVTLLRLPERELPDVIYLEQLIGASYPEQEDVEYYRHVIDRLVTDAAPARETRGILLGMLDAL